jgi:flagellar biogenesis protein FliO
MDIWLLPRLLSALGVIALLLYGLSCILRYESAARLRDGGRRRLITPIETTVLSQTSALHVVRIVNQYYVLSSSGGQVGMIRTLEKAAVEAHVNALRSRRGVTVGTLLRTLRRRFIKNAGGGGGRMRVR